jgi:hypothetical protein
MGRADPSMRESNRAARASKSLRAGSAPQFLSDLPRRADIGRATCGSPLSPLTWGAIHKRRPFEVKHATSRLQA